MFEGPESAHETASILRLKHENNKSNVSIQVQQILTNFWYVRKYVFDSDKILVRTIGIISDFLYALVRRRQYLDVECCLDVAQVWC